MGQLLSWNKQIRKNIALLSFLLIILFFPLQMISLSPYESETGTLAIYFMQEQVGYEEYSWEEDETGFTLTVRGKMTKPIAIETERLVIRIDKSYIPESFAFKGQVSGVRQEIQSYFAEGKVVNTMRVAGQDRTETVDVKRDAVLLPNPMFSPYMVLTKKFRCSLQEAKEISAYIIPQMEIPSTLQPKKDFPCHYVLRVGTAQIEMETDEEGVLTSLGISSQNLRVLRTQVGVPIR
jgi:hypothetical protein